MMKMKKENDEHRYDYLSLYKKDAEKDFQNDKKIIPTWILRDFTVRQMEQIRNTRREERFTGNRQTIPKLYKLMTFK